MAAVGPVATDRASAAEPHIADMKVISSDATARFLPLGIDKSVVIELPKDVHDVLIGNEKIVNAVVRSKRRVYIIGVERGETNVYFFDVDGRQIGALDVYVQSGIQPSPAENFELPANVVVVYRGEGRQAYSCTPTLCTGPEVKPPLPAGYTDMTTHVK
jgi:hypothetical protein